MFLARFASGTSTAGNLLELEAIAAAIPAIPSDYATLRALIHSLPDPLLANLLGTRSGVPDASLGDIAEFLEAPEASLLR